MKKITRRNITGIIMSIWVGGFIQFYGTIPVYAISSSLEQKREVQYRVNNSIQMAEKLTAEGKLSEALRILYDAAKEEKITHLSGEAQYKIYQMIQSLIHEDNSPLMQRLRDTTIPVSEKNALLLRLNDLVSQKDFLKKSSFENRIFAGPLIKLLTSPQLIIEEKQQIVRQITLDVRKEYISEEQKRQISQEILQQLTLSEQHFKEAQYAIAFRAVLDASKKALEAGIVSQTSDYYHEYLDWLAIKEPSSLMMELRNTRISWQKKLELFRSLERMVEDSKTTVLQESLQEYRESPLIELMNSSLLQIHEKRQILLYVEEVIQKEYSPLP